MNKFQKKFEDLKQGIIEEFLPGFKQQHGDDSQFEFLVQDPVNCRSFELDTFYEFSEWELQDISTLDFYLEINCIRTRGDQRQVLSRLGSGRITGYPCSPNVVMFTDLIINEFNSRPFLSVLEFLGVTMKAYGAILNIAARNEVETTLSDLGYKEFTKAPFNRERTQFFLFKKL